MNLFAQNLPLTNLPPGLSYLPDFISPSVEAHLIAQIDQGTWNFDLKRRTQHYGYRYYYQAKMVLAKDRLGALADWLADVAMRLVQTGIFDNTPDQGIINEYLPGQGITPHIDCLPCFGEIIASVSLLAPVVMDFDEPATGEKISLSLTPCSMLVLQGAARRTWRHGIAARKSDKIDGAQSPRKRRLSLTFREVVLAR